MLLEQIDLSQDVDILDGLLNDGSEAIEKFRTIMNSLWMTGRCSLNEYNFAAHNLHRVSCILGGHCHCYGYSVQVGRKILLVVGLNVDGRLPTEVPGYRQTEQSKRNTAPPPVPHLLA